MTLRDSIKVRLYQDWMLDQIVALNVEHYHAAPEKYRYAFHKICNDPFTLARSVPLVALEGKTVVGVQTYRYLL